MNIFVNKIGGLWKFHIYVYYECEYVAVGLVFWWTFHYGSASCMDSGVRQMARIQEWHHLAEHEKTRSPKIPQQSLAYTSNYIDADENTSQMMFTEILH